MTNNPINQWTTKKSEELYGISNWGQGYFHVNDEGELNIAADKNAEKSTSLMDIVRGIEERGMDMPVLLRFGNILDNQITVLNEAFRTAMDSLGYKGSYRGAYPVKVNQQQQVIHEIAKYGKKYHHGFEVGSKPELIAALSEIADYDSNIICNGYKDPEFIDLGLLAIKMGYKVFFVIEMPGEAQTITARAKALGINPNIGIRIKLSTKAGGHWTDSGGDRSIFGLNFSQVIETIDYLNVQGMLEHLKLMHYHLGSQIPNIRDIRVAVKEAARVYSELVKEGATMGYLDLGGGLAVDYDGSNTNENSSRNYSTQEYAMDIVEAVMTVMDDSGIKHPTIITESGRALVAYYSMLVFNVLDVQRFHYDDMPGRLPKHVNEMVENLYEVYGNLNQKNLQESYNDASYYREMIKDAFNQGNMTIRERGLGEKLYWNVMSRISDMSKDLKKMPPELMELESAMADIYYCNFSVFQSIPDNWAIGQLFPIIPIHRLNEEPVRSAVLADITCDCDGEINEFINMMDDRKTLPMHTPKADEPYYVGVFLVGAYQETLGDLHNLFGDTNVISIQFDELGEYEFNHEIQGDTVEDVLSVVEFDPKFIRLSLKNKAEMAVKAGRITANERKQILETFENGLRGYTYYEL